MTLDVLGPGQLYYFNGTDWVPAGVPPFQSVEASGGTETTIDVNGVDYRLHTFTEDDDFVVTQGGDVEVFCVGGGGSGGVRNFTYGGGGGFTATDTVEATVGTHPVVVGAGGASVGPSTSNLTGLDGDPSSALGVEAAGGGGAQDQSGDRFGGDGGSGGGASRSNGGSDGADGDGEDLKGGSGQGTTTRAFGDPSGVLYAGGGGGSSSDATGFGEGGAGGGGDGGSPSSPEGKPGTANTGGGGGAGQRTNGTGAASGAGGSGIVLIRYPLEA